MELSGLLKATQKAVDDWKSRRKTGTITLTIDMSQGGIRRGHLNESYPLEITREGCFPKHEKIEL